MLEIVIDLLKIIIGGIILVGAICIGSAGIAEGALSLYDFIFEPDEKK